MNSLSPLISASTRTSLSLLFRSNGDALKEDGENPAFDDLKGLDKYPSSGHGIRGGGKI